MSTYDVILGPFRCWLIRLFGGKHKWRRLTKKERDARIARGTADTISAARICRRCGAERIAAKRKTKLEAT